jgi:hypothetical protein
VTRKWFVVPVAAVVALGIPSAARLHALPAAADPGGYGQQYGWDVPPGEYNEVQRRGFHDGVEGARKDYGNGRSPDVDNRDEYRRPGGEVPPELREVYRRAFRQGYQVAASHLWSAGAPPVVAPVAVAGQWEWGMQTLRKDVERQGYRDGMATARDQINRHDRRDPDDLPRYMNPPVPPPSVEQYRAGFMMGYEVALSQMEGDGAWPTRGDPKTWTPPGRYDEIKAIGFRHGAEAAGRDFSERRTPNPAFHENYRMPPVPQGEIPRHEYRDGFRLGYEMAIHRLWQGVERGY